MTPLLTIVMTGRNDDRDSVARLRWSVASVVHGANAADLPLELLIVEWNPPRDRPGLAHALDLPRDVWPVQWRIVTVPRDIHESLGEGPPLREHMARNVGLRRAKGRFVLVAGSGCRFPGAIFRILKTTALDPAAFYRADTLDVAVSQDFDAVASDPDDDVLREGVLRAHTLRGATTVEPGGPIHCSIPGETLPRATTILSAKDVFTDGAEEFLLASQAAWLSAGGFRETEADGACIDAMCCLDFMALGLAQCILPGDCAVLRPTGDGVGTAPEGAERCEAYAGLLERILDGEDVFEGRPEDWGLAGKSLRELSGGGEEENLIFLWAKPEELLLQHETILRRVQKGANALFRNAERERLMEMRSDFEDVLHLEPEECAAQFKRNEPLNIPDDSPVSPEGIDLSRNVALHFFPVPVVEGAAQDLTFTMEFPGKGSVRGTVLVQDELQEVHLVREFETADGKFSFMATVPECRSFLRVAMLPPGKGRERGPIPVPTTVHVTSNASNRAFFVMRFWYRKFTRLAESMGKRR
ncbi:MAG: hypothetical protein LBR22_10845 [Desulfovibrio sp.]|jgi:hypothetical protein|nr:hypothetical protein [Desulfovibrio sp.]